MDSLPVATPSQLKAQGNLAARCEEVDAALAKLTTAIEERDAALQRAIWAKVPDQIIIATTGFTRDRVFAMKNALG